MGVVGIECVVAQNFDRVKFLKISPGLNLVNGNESFERRNCGQLRLTVKSHELQEIS